MSTFATRLRHAMDRAGVNQIQLANAVEVSAPSIHAWLNSPGRRVRADLLLRAADFLQVDPSWLATGHGRMEARGGSVSGVSEIATPKGYVRLELLDTAGGMGGGIVNEEFPEVVRSMEYAEWDIRQRLGFLPKPGRLKLITGRGPSMSPVINNGDVVMVDTQVNYFDGDAIYVIMVSDETQIKGLQRRTDGLYVVSANPLFPPYPAPADLHIAGKALVHYSAKQLV